MKYFITILSLLLLTACVSDDDYTIPIYVCSEPTLSSNKTIRNIYDQATKNPVKYTFDDIIEGYVTSSDKEGNFYKSVSFQSLDQSIGFSVPIDDSNLYLNFEPGRKVFVKLHNNYTDLSHDGLRIGSLFVYTDSRSATVGRISVFDYKKTLIRSCQKINESELISIIPLDSINDNRLNTLIKIKNVQFSSESQGRHLYESTMDVGGATNHLIENESSQQLIFRVSSYADFSLEKVPSGKGSVIGVLTKYKDDYQLTPRYYSDLEF